MLFHQKHETVEISPGQSWTIQCGKVWGNCGQSCV